MRLENTMTIKKENVELDKLVSQVTDRYMVDFENRNIECEVKGHAVIQADLRLIELLIDNLVMNMAKYAADDSHASIEIDDDQIVFSNKMACAIDCEPSELWEPIKERKHSENRTHWKWTWTFDSQKDNGVVRPYRRDNYPRWELYSRDCF